MQGFPDQLNSIAQVERRPCRAAVEIQPDAVRTWRTSLAAASPLRLLRRLLAGAAFLALAAPRTALAQTASIVESPSTGLGNIVAAASGATTFRFDSVAGAVSQQGGAGVRMTSGSAVLQVTITCTSGKNSCASGNSLVQIQPSGTKTGRAQALARFTVTMGTAKLSGSAPTPGSPISFTIQKLGNGKTGTFTIGADFAVDGDDKLNTEATGLASSGVQVTVSAPSGAGAVVSTGAMTATVLRTPSLKILNNSALNFGRIVRPSSGTSAILLPASTGTLTVTGTAIALPTPAPTRVQLQLSGEGHQTVSVTVPSTVILSSTVGTVTSTLSMTTSNTAQGTQQLSGTPGGTGSASSGTLDFYVGGAFAISPTTPTGVYQGNIVITAQYN